MGAALSKFADAVLVGRGGQGRGSMQRELMGAARPGVFLETEVEELDLCVLRGLACTVSA